MTTFDLGFADIGEAAYHADAHTPVPSLSSTMLRGLIATSPLHVWNASTRLNPAAESTDRPAFAIGRVAHREVLGRGAGYTEIPAHLLSSNGAAGTKAAKDFKADAEGLGLTVLKADEIARIKAAAAAARRGFANIGVTLDHSESERVAYAEINGVLCRAMFDNAPAAMPVLFDLKTTQDANPAAVIRSIERYGYDVQAQHYREVWHALTGEWRRFVFCFQETTAPFATCFIELHDDPGGDADWIEAATAKTAKARAIWRECLATDKWPGYPAEIVKVGARSWHTRDWIGEAA